MEASEDANYVIGGEEYRVLERLSNLAASRTLLVEASRRRMHLRLISGCRADDVELRSRKLRELAAAGAGLVAPLEVCESDGQVCALRAWVDAEPFDAYARRFKFSAKRLEQALNIGVKLCRTVEGLHHARIAHGALRNTNVFFEKDGSPVVTDPVLGDSVPAKQNALEDVRALGLLLCRLYTGKPELVINDYTLMMLAKARVPRQLLRVLWQAIHEEPSMRFPDAATLGRALREVPLPEYQRTVQVRALPDNVGPSDGLPPWLRNAAIFVVVLGMIAGAAWLLRGYGSKATSASSQPVASATPAAGSATIDARLLRPRFTFETNLGKIEIEANGDAAPIAVLNFARHVEAGSFDGVAFDRVVPNVVIQAGQFTMTGDRKRSSLPPVRNEWLNGAEAVAGTVGMSRQGNDPDTITTTFFINLADNRRAFGTRKDGTGEVIFGKVVGGADVVQSISKSKTVNKNGGAWPEPPVYITSAYFSQGFESGEVLRALEGKQPPRTTLESGVVVEDVVIGRGREFDPSRSVTLHYVGKLENGKRFDSSRDRGEPSTFPAGRYLQGLAEGLGGMRVGGRRFITIPPELGYGGTEIPGIPANSTLVFDVQFVSQAASEPPLALPASSGVANGDPPAQPAGSIRVVYHRYDNVYDRPGLWVWNPDRAESIPGREIKPVHIGDEGASFDIRMKDLGVQGRSGERIGIIPRLRSSWDFKDGSDRFWTPDLGNAVWLVQDDNSVYSEAPVREPAVKQALLEDERTVRFLANHPLNEAMLNNTGSFQVNLAGRSITATKVLPVRDGNGAVISALATFPSSLFPLPPQATASIAGMKESPLLLGAIQKDPSRFNMDAPMGVSFVGGQATFTVFAPNAQSLNIEIFGSLDATSPSRTVPMRQGENSIWEASTAKSEVEGSFYSYSVTLRGERQPKRVADPAAVNHVGRPDRTRVTDPRSTDPPGFRPIPRPSFSGEMKDAVIYELHVQAFTAGGGTTHRQPGKYLGVVETGTTLSSARSVTTGLDHLKELRVTHVQLMPVSEFVPAPGSKGGYDWGYWPLAWMTPRGDFASTKDGDVRLREFKQMVQALHAEGIGVIVDLPLAQLSVQTSIESIAPGAFTFPDVKGRPATIGDQAYRIDSTAPAARALMLQTVRFWMEEMGADGVRIEGLGHIDMKTAEEILATARAINPAALIYGTPWGSGPSPHGQTTDKAALAGTGVAAYNDTYRDALKGEPLGSIMGFVQEPRSSARKVEGLIAGSIDEFATSPNDVLNLLTDHDGCTLWDKLAATTNLPDQERMKVHLLAQGILLVTQGGVLLNGGDELIWSRNGDCWGWEAGLQVNITPWANKARYRFSTEYLAGLIALRREHPVFRLGSAEEIRTRVRFLPAAQLPDPSCITLTINGSGLDGEAWATVFIAINPTPGALSLRLPDAQTWQVHVENGRASTSPLSVATGRVQVPGRTIMVMAR